MPNVQDQKDLEFVKYVISNTIEFPEQLELTRTVDDYGVLITIKAAPSDMGKIIGSRGKNIESLRTIVRMMGAKMNARIAIQLDEPGYSSERYRGPRKSGAFKDFSKSTDEKTGKTEL